MGVKCIEGCVKYNDNMCCGVCEDKQICLEYTPDYICIKCTGNKHNIQTSEEALMECEFAIREE